MRTPNITTDSLSQCAKVWQAYAADKHRHAGLQVAAAAAPPRSGSRKRCYSSVPLVHAGRVCWHISGPQSAAARHPACSVRNVESGCPEPRRQPPALHSSRVWQVNHSLDFTTAFPLSNTRADARCSPPAALTTPPTGCGRRRWSWWEALALLSGQLRHWHNPCHPDN